MLNITQGQFYENKRRALKLWWVDFHIGVRFYWAPKPPDVPRIYVSWMRAGRVKFGHAHYVRARLYASRTVKAYGGYSSAYTQSSPFDVAAPEFRDMKSFTDLLQISRFVAANKAPLHALIDWIEEYMPEPWSFLATETPMRFFRAVCPIPLAVSEEDERVQAV